MIRRLAFSPDGRQLFAASLVTGELVVYDTESLKELSSFYVASRLEGMHVTRDHLYLLSAEGLFRIPLSKLRSSSGRDSGLAGGSGAAAPFEVRSQ
jgi:hypothetical protein